MIGSEAFKETLIERDSFTILLIGFSFYAHSYLSRCAPNGVEVNHVQQIAPGDADLELDQFHAQRLLPAHHRHEDEENPS